MTTLDQIGADSDSGDFPEFLSRDQKHELAANQHPLWIIGGVVRQEGKFEPQTFYTVKFGKPGKTTKTQTGDEIVVTAPGWAANTDAWTLALTANDEREQQMQKIKEALAGADFIGPVFLWATKTKSGNDYYKVRGTRDENPQPMDDSPAPVIKHEPASDADIPF